MSRHAGPVDRRGVGRLDKQTNPYRMPVELARQNRALLRSWARATRWRASSRRWRATMWTPSWPPCGAGCWAARARDRRCPRGGPSGERAQPSVSLSCLCAGPA